MTSHERNKRRMARLPASVRALVREGKLSADRAVLRCSCGARLSTRDMITAECAR